MDLWNWLTVVAIVMATYPLIQAIIGLPKIEINFEIEDRLDIAFIHCSIQNMPITDKIQKFLRFRRDSAEDVHAFFGINESGTGKVIVPMGRNARIRFQYGELKERVYLPPSAFPVHALIAGISKEDKTVYIPDNKSEEIANRIILSPGEYVVSIKVFADNKLYQNSAKLVIMNEYPFAYFN